MPAAALDSTMAPTVSSTAPVADPSRGHHRHRRRRHYGEHSRGAIYSANHIRRIQPKPESISLSQVQSQTQSQFWDSFKALDDHIVKKGGDLEKGFEPTGRRDFRLGLRTLSYKDNYLEVRNVMGIQIMIQLQCKALVEKFKVNSMIFGLAVTIWLRFVALTRVLMIIGRMRRSRTRNHRKKNAR